MFRLRNKKNKFSITQSYLEVGYERPLYNNTLSNELKRVWYRQSCAHRFSLMSCLVFLFFSLKMLCDNISAFQMETNRGFIVIMILIRFVPSLFYHY